MKLLKAVLEYLTTSHEERMIRNFLANATDLADLEWRMKEVRNGTFQLGRIHYV